MKKSLVPGRKYKVSTGFLCFENKPFSSYFGVVLLDENNVEKDRKIKWIFKKNTIDKKYRE